MQEVDQADDPAKAYEGLSEEEKQVIVDNLLTHTLTINGQTAVNLTTGAVLTEPETSELASMEVGETVPYALSSGCWAVKSSGYGANVAGVKTVEYGQTTQICVRRNRVRSVSVTDTWSRIHMYGWRTKKQPRTKTKNVGWEGRGRAQFYFVCGTGGWDIQHLDPCLQNRVNRDGVHYAVSSSCEL